MTGRREKEAEKERKREAGGRRRSCDDDGTTRREVHGLGDGDGGGVEETKTVGRLGERWRGLGGTVKGVGGLSERGKALQKSTETHRTPLRSTADPAPPVRIKYTRSYTRFSRVGGSF